MIARRAFDTLAFALPTVMVAQLQAQAHPLHLAFRLPSFQGVPGPPPAELFFARPWTVAND
jgi:hypothetical protein